MREDEIIKNKYNLPIKRQCFEDYIDRLIGSIYKLLPTFEGKSSLDHQVIYTPEIAYKHFQMNLEEVIIEVVGNYYIYNNNSKILELMGYLDGLRDIKIDEHEILRTIIFKCTNLCVSLKEELNDNENK